MRSAHSLTGMTRRLLLASALFSGGAAALDAQGAAADRLNGTWSGYIGRSEATPSPVKVELLVRGDGTLAGIITGTQITPGEITAGTFDPATNAIKFTVVVHERGGQAGGLVTFDGRVANDTASGKLTLGGETGVFKFMRGAAAAGAGSSSAAGAARPTGDQTAAVRRGFIEVTGWITRAAELVPAERYSYRPVSTVRTFGQVVGHVIDGARYYCGRGAGRDVSWRDSTEKTVTTKAALVEALARSIAECGPVYDGGAHIGPLMENVAHSNLHYGNLVTYMRMLGLVPPSS